MIILNSWDEFDLNKFPDYNIFDLNNIPLTDMNYYKNLIV